MKTKELIEKLNQLDPDGELAVCMYDDRSLIPVDVDKLYKMEQPKSIRSPTIIPFPIIMIEPY